MTQIPSPATFAECVDPLVDTVWEHHKGGLYTVLMLRGEDLLYACHRSGQLFWRPAAEFADGRFQLRLDVDPIPFKMLDVIRG